MQFSEQWLRTYVNPPISSEELAHRLTMAGLEVEANEPVAPPFSRVVIGRVRTVARHPNADKLTVCEVDTGTGTMLSVVCGAPNVAQGICVPCALVGAVLPGDFRIKATTVRGVESQGMLCSARELGLSEDHSGLMILAPDAPLGRDVRDYLALEDRKLTIKLTPNRGDCLSVIGVAREVAAITGAPMALPGLEAVRPTIDERLLVRIHAPDLCGRFSGRVVRGLNAAAPTPEWMKQRLERSGQRPISALVDISNYVMLEFGRPSHIFDLDKVQGSLQVRWGRSGERVELLNGQSVEVDEQVGVIADDARVEALAGVMGGAATAVSLDTRNIYIEAAFWWPESIQGRSRRYNFSTDAAHRFERGVDFATTVDHIEVITQLVLSICGTQATRVGPIDDQILRLPERKPVRLRTDRCRKVLGVAIEDEDMAQIFRRLGLSFIQSGGAFLVTPPPYRFDLEIEEDLIEEVARLWGFERIPAEAPRAGAAMRLVREDRRSPHALRREMAQAGYQELVNFSFVDAAWEADFAGNDRPIKVLNPIAAQLAVMRSTLIGGLVSVLRYNLNRKASRVRVFELGRVFLRDSSVEDGPLSVAGTRQPLRIAALAYGLATDEQWGERRRDVDFFDVKGDVERLLGSQDVRFVAKAHPGFHPGRAARICCNGSEIGWIGELHPRWLQKYEFSKAPIVFEIDVEPLLSARLPFAQAVPRFPAVVRDIALIVDESVTAQKVFDAVDALRQTDGRLSSLREFRLFDLYRPSAADSSKVAGVGANALLNKEKSLAFKIVLQDTERTLSDADVDAAIAVMVEGLTIQIGAKLRQ
jgi:phenylalanyl-tRNA synthetase beta chain